MARAHDRFEISYFELTLMDGVSLEANVGCITLSKIITPQFLEKKFDFFSFSLNFRLLHLPFGLLSMIHSFYCQMIAASVVNIH